MTLPENDVLKQLEAQLKQQEGSKEEGKKDETSDEKKPEAAVDVMEQMKKLADAVHRRIEELEKGALRQTGFDGQLKKEDKNEDDERLFKMLEAMTPEQRAQWASETGAAGVMKLLEFKERQLAKKLEELERKADSMPVEVLAQEWRTKRKEWLEDEEVAAFAEGVDRMLLRKRGVRSYRELSPEELREHLAELDKRVEDFIRKLGKMKEEEEGKEGKAGFRSVGDAAGGATGDVDLAVDITKLSGFDLESLSFEQLKKLEEKLMKGGV